MEKSYCNNCKYCNDTDIVCHENDIPAFHYQDFPYSTSIIEDTYKKTCQITSVSIYLFSHIIEHNKLLQHLSIINMSNDSLRLVLGYIKRTNSLTSLSIHGIKKFNPKILRRIMKIIKVNPNITAFGIHVNKINDFGMQIIANEIKTNTSLKYLTLTGNMLTKNGVDYLAEALIHNTTLQSLNLSLNHFSGSKLFTIFNVNNSLRELDFSESDINFGDLYALSKSMKHNASLQSINLNNSLIDTNDVIKFLLYNPSITHIDVKDDKHIIQEIIHSHSCRIKRMPALFTKICERENSMFSDDSDDDNGRWGGYWH